MVRNSYLNCGSGLSHKTATFTVWPPEEIVVGYEAAFVGELQKKQRKLTLQNSEKLSKAQLYAATVRARNPQMQVRRVA